MKKVLISFVIGIITGILLLYGYYTYKYVDTEKFIEAIITHEYNFTVNMLKIFIFFILLTGATAIILSIAYYTWVYLIQKTHKKIKKDKRSIAQAYSKFKQEKELFEKEKQDFYKKMKEELEQQKKQLTLQLQKETELTKKLLEVAYQEKLNELKKWKKTESYEKEKLKQRLKCLENKITELFQKRAKKFKETNPGRYKKELKKAEKTISECKNQK